MVENILGIAIDTKAIINTSAIGGIIVGSLIIIIIILIVWWYISKHDKKVYLLYKTGDGLVLKTNKAEKNIKSRTMKLLWSRNIKCQYPESKHTILEKGKECFIGYVVNDVCTWLEVDASRLVASDANLMNFLVEEFVAIDEITKVKLSFWDKFGKDILWMMTIVVVMIIIIMILKSLDRVVDMVGGVANQMTTAVNHQVQNTTQIL